VKGTELANLCPDTIGEAAEVVDAAIERVGSDTALAFAFWRRSSLSL
jgi:hypothetical protein